MKKRKKLLAIALLVVMASMGVLQDAPSVAAKTMRVSVSAKTVQVGKQLKMRAKTAGLHYKSLDSTIASVNKRGVITGKRAGTTKIVASRKGYSPKKFAIKVKAGKNKPSLDVALDEVKLQSARMRKQKDGTWQYSAIIRNTAKKGKIHKIQYYYRIGLGGPYIPPHESEVVSQAGAMTKDTSAKCRVYKTVTLTANNIKAGKKSARVSCQGAMDGKISSMNLVKVVLYTGEAVYTYKADSGKGILAWSEIDLTGPEFSGWVGKHSIYNGEPIRVCYSDRKGSYDFLDHVKAVDARDGKVSVSVNTGKVDWNKEGIYKVYYTAKDKSGNKSKAWAKVQVYKPGTAEKYADVLLSSSLKSNSDIQKLRKIYNYVQSHCSYTGGGAHHNWRAAAVHGIRNHSGDCFTYYSIAKLLITRAGFSNLTVRRYPYREGSNHWWNLVYTGKGWYHFDTTPRQRKGYFCLQTDEQLHMYSTGSTFRFQTGKYPKRAKKKISRNPI